VSGWVFGMGFLAWYWATRILVARGRMRAGTWSATKDDARDLASPPTISVCIPARDEAEVIAGVVGDVLAQDYPGLTELILVDDRSSDGTADVARAAANGDERLRIVLGDGPPPGWMGKSAACWRAQQEATGDWLLFVDADVRLDPTALRVAMGKARDHGAHMLSWFGQLETRSFWEHVLMPFIGDLIALSAPRSRVNDPSRDDCLANGQFLLIARSAYDEVGGHEAIKESVVDDVSMGRAVKFAEPVGHLRYVLLFSVGLMNVRMYDSFRAVWNGFTKNFYTAGQGNVPLLLVTIGYLLATSVLPFAALPYLAWRQDWPGAVAAGLAVGAILAFGRFVRRSGFTNAPFWSALLQPLAAAVVCGIIVDSTLRGLGLRKGVQWKGRTV
jgi:glycosyltransferase involved in cell wall biosynthesis